MQGPRSEGQVQSLLTDGLGPRVNFRISEDGLHFL